MCCKQVISGISLPVLMGSFMLFISTKGFNSEVKKTLQFFTENIKAQVEN